MCEVLELGHPSQFLSARWWCCNVISLYRAHSLYVFCTSAIDQELHRCTLVQSRVQALVPLVSLSVLWQPVCCPGESRSPLPSLRAGAASSSQNTRSGVRYQETVYCQDVKMSRVQSSVYFIQTSATRMEGGQWCIRWRTAAQVRILREDVPFNKIRLRPTWLPRNTRKFRWLITLAMSLIVVWLLVAIDNFIMSPAYQTVS